MGKLEQEIRKLSKHEIELLQAALDKLKVGSFDLLQLKKLKGEKDLYRIRIGRIRIVYELSSTGEPILIAVRKRSEKTYKNL